MKKCNSIVAIYKSHIEAKTSIKKLGEAGFDRKKLSIAGETIISTNKSSVITTPATA